MAAGSAGYGATETQRQRRPAGGSSGEPGAWQAGRVECVPGGDTLHGRTEARTRERMTLGGFALRFFSADSKFYPEFDALCRERVRAAGAGQAWAGL